MVRKIFCKGLVVTSEHFGVISLCSEVLRSYGQGQRHPRSSAVFRRWGPGSERRACQSGDDGIHRKETALTSRARASGR